MHGEKGQALPLAMLALTIGALIITPFLGHAGTSLISSRTYASAIGNRNAADAGAEHAIWSLTRGTLAAQIPNSGDHITYQLGEALNGVNTTITVTTNATGTSTAGTITDAVIDTLDYDTANSNTPDIIQVSSNVCAMVYRGASNRGYLKTASIAADGSIGNAVISTLNFVTTICYEPDIYQVAGNIYAIAYRGASNTGNIITVSIAANGVIGGSVISSLVFDTSTCYEPVITQVASTIFAIAYRGGSTRGYLKTVSIAANGTIGGSVISTLIFDAATAYEPDIIQVASGIYAIAYRSTSNRGIIATESVAANGTIGSSVISTLIFDASTCFEPDIVMVASNIFAIAYRGTSNDGYLKTVSIAANGTIGGSAISTLIFDAATAYEPVIVQVASNTFAIAYRSSTSLGYLKTVTIASDGTISPTVFDTLNFEASTCFEPSLINMTGSIFAIAYRGPSTDGYLATVSITTSGWASAAYRIVSAAGNTTINALVNTSNTTASIVSWQIQ